MKILELKTGRDEAAQKAADKERIIAAKEAAIIADKLDLAELHADIAAFDRLISRHCSEDDDANEDKTQKSASAESPPLQRVNVAALFRKELSEFVGTFTQSSLCQLVREKHPLVQFNETSIAPYLSRLAKDNVIAVVTPRHGAQPAVYRVANREALAA